MKHAKLFAQVAVSLLLVALFTALPLTNKRVIITMGDIEVMPLPSDLEALGAYPPGQTFVDFVGGSVTFDQDMIDIDQIPHPQGR